MEHIVLQNFYLILRTIVLLKGRRPVTEVQTMSWDWLFYKRVIPTFLSSSLAFEHVIIKQEDASIDVGSSTSYYNNYPVPDVLIYNRHAHKHLHLWVQYYLKIMHVYG